MASPQHKFTLGPGVYRIINPASGKAMDLAGYDGQSVIGGLLLNLSYFLTNGES
jgi:hypothetical protein